MSYTALYRKFRPNTFAEVKGQDAIVTTLKNQIKANRIGHAYLFTGTRGTGKTSVAKLFARTVNCEQPINNEPCGKCKSCLAIAAKASMNVIEMDAASNNSVENIRKIVEEVSYSPVEGKYKVYIIDEVHMLSIGAFNALLKTLEEPPSYVIFILATTEVNKLPITILSRCQRYDFKRISIDTITKRMQELLEAEGILAQERALRYIAKAADGSLRDALSLLDQCIAFYFGKELTYDKVLDVLGAVDTEVFSRLLHYLLEKDVLSCICLLEEIIMQGRELTQFVTDFTWYLRNLMLAQSSEQLEDVIDMSSDNLQRLKEEAELLQINQVIRYIRIFSELSGQIRYASQKRVLVEIAFVKLCRPSMETSFDSLLERIRDIEEKVENVVKVQEKMREIPAGTVFSETVEAAASEENTTLLEQKSEKLFKAIPEEVKKIVDNWYAIIRKAPWPMKGYLEKGKLSLGRENQLIVAIEDGIYSDYFTKNSENKEQLEQLLSEFLGKQIEVIIQPIKSAQEFENNYIDLQKVIHMEIETEE